LVKKRNRVIHLRAAQKNRFISPTAETAENAMENQNKLSPSPTPVDLPQQEPDKRVKRVVHVVPPRDPRVLAEWRPPTRAELLSIIPDCSPLYRDLAGMVADCLPGTDAKYPPLPPLPADYQPNEHSVAKSCAKGDLRQLQWHVERKGEDVNQQDSRWSMLHWACCSGKLQCVQYLLSRGANPAAHTSRSCTPLMLASAVRYWDIARYLLHHHNDIAPVNPADPPGRVCDIRNNDGRTVLHLCDHSPELTRELVLQYGMDPNQDDDEGNTPLHLAARLGRLEIARVLVEECGANPNMRNCHGQTAADLAECYGESATAKYLLTRL
jgi:hypothetical protein